MDAPCTNALLQNPDRLAEYSDIEGDHALLELAPAVYEALTGQELESVRLSTPKPRGPRINVASRRALLRRFPKLAQHKGW